MVNLLKRCRATDTIIKFLTGLGRCPKSCYVTLSTSVIEKISEQLFRRQLKINMGRHFGGNSNHDYIVEVLSLVLLLAHPCLLSGSWKRLCNVCVHYFTCCFKNWCRLLSLDHNRYPRASYDMLKVYDDSGKVNWLSQIRILPFETCFSCVWISKSCGNVDMFIKKFYSVVMIGNYRNGMHK